MAYATDKFNVNNIIKYGGSIVSGALVLGAVVLGVNINKKK